MKNIMKRLICCFLIIVMLVPSLSVFSFAVDVKSLSDIDGHWAEEALVYWANEGVFDSIPENEFGLTKPVSRAVFVTIFNHIMNVKADADKAISSFKDVKEDSWYYDEITTARKSGYITGVNEFQFKPEANITREDVCVIVNRYLHIADIYDSYRYSTFTDSDSISKYATKSVAALSELGIIKGYEDSSFLPKDDMTCAEAVTICDRIYQLIKGESGLSGRVYFENKPLVNADLNVYKKGDYNLFKQVTTDINGDYSIDLEPGNYDITIIKNEKINFLSDIEVQSGLKQYKKLETFVGQNVTGYLKDGKDVPVANTDVYFKFNPYFRITTDINGYFSTYLPVKSKGEIYIIKDGTLTNLINVSTSKIDAVLSLGTIYTEQKQSVLENQMLPVPAWWWIYLNSQINTPDKPDVPVTPGEYDYSKLPLREDKSYDELTDINGGEKPYIELNDNGQIGLYIGKISENPVNNVYDVIAELNNVRGLLDIGDARFEFIPSEANYQINDTTYRLQQVYNGIPVMASEIIVGIDDSKHIVSFTNDYINTVRFSGIDTEISLKDIDIKNTINNYFLGYEVIYDTIKLMIYDENPELIYYSYIYANNCPYYCIINAQSGEINSVISDEIETYNVNYQIYSDGIEETNEDDKDYHDILEAKEFVPCPIHNDVNICQSEGFITDWQSIISNVYFNDEIIKEKFDTQWQAINYDVQIYENLLGYKCNNDFTIIKLGDWNNCASAGKTTDNKNILLFGSAFDYSSIDLTYLWGHEYTHTVQDSLVSGGKFGSGFTNITSGNHAYVESKAISEGTADVMGLIFQAYKNNIISATDWNDILYVCGNSLNPDTPYSNNPNVALNEHFNIMRSYNDIEKYYSNNYERINTYCKECEKQGNKIKYNKLTYGAGIGHAQRYICGGILYTMVTSGLNNPEVLMELWYGAMCRLNCKSNLHDLRQALYQTGVDLNFNEYSLSVIGIACDSVDINDNTGKTNYIPWYFSSYEKAINNNIIQDHTNDNPYDYTTRAEYLTMLMNLCNTVGLFGDYQIYNLYSGNISSHWAVKQVSFFFNLGYISSEWLSDISYLNDNIPRWQATLILFQVLNKNYEQFKDKGWKVVYGYPYGSESGNDNYFDFTHLGFTDWGKNIPKQSSVDLTHILQYYPNVNNISSFQQQYMNSKVTTIKYVTNVLDENTINSLYYMGFYQLWMNGMFNGSINPNESMQLKATDALTRAEACALITQVIPD